MVASTSDLARFVDAQEGIFDTAILELRSGQKRTHWMWFIFPQLRGLGRSSAAEFYGLANVEEALAYLAHPLLGPRLVQAVQAAETPNDRTLQQIFGSPDDLKFHSSMTLFSVAAESPHSPYDNALKRWFRGRPDEATLRLLEQTND